MTEAILNKFVEILNITEDFVVHIQLDEDDEVKVMKLPSVDFLGKDVVSRVSLGAISKFVNKQFVYKPATFDWTKCLLMIDIDSKDFIDEVLFVLQGLDLMPSVVVETKRGYHLLYVYDKVYTVEDLADLEKLERFASRELKSFLNKKFAELNIQVKVDKVGTFLYTRKPLSLRVFDEVKNVVEVKDFIAKLEKMTGRKCEVEVQGVDGFVIDLNEFTYKDAFEVLKYCPIFKWLDENTHLHNYYQWKFWAFLYVNAYYLAKTEEERAYIKELFHNKAILHEDYQSHQNEKLFSNLLEYCQKRGSIVPVKCESLREACGDELCSGCGYNKVVGTPYVFLTGFDSYTFKFDNMVAKVKKREDGFYVSYLGKTNNDLFVSEWRKLCNLQGIEFIVNDRTHNQEERNKLVYFKVRDKLVEFPYYLVFAQNMRKFKTVTSAKEIVDTTCRISDDLDWIVLYELVKRLVYDFENDEANKLKIYTLSLDFQLNYVDEGFPLYSWDFYQLVTGRKIFPKIYWRKDGDSEEFYSAVRDLFKVDKAFQLLVGFSLLQFLHSEKYKDIFTLQETPILLLAGEPGGGKTLRLNVVMSLWGRGHYNPCHRVYSFTQYAEMTEAFFSYVLPSACIPVVLDDIDERKGKDLGELLKTLANANFGMMRQTAHLAYHAKPLRSVLMLSAELKKVYNLLKHYEEFTGTARRIVLMTLSDEDDVRVRDELRNCLLKLYKLSENHYGHIDVFEQYLCNNKDVVKKYFLQAKKEFDKNKIEATLSNFLSLTVGFAKVFSEFLQLDYPLDHFIRLVYHYILTDIRSEDAYVYFLLNVKTFAEKLLQEKSINGLYFRKIFKKDQKINMLYEVLFGNWTQYKDEDRRAKYYVTFSYQQPCFLLYVADLSKRSIPLDYRDVVKALLYNLDMFLFKQKKFTDKKLELLEWFRTGFGLDNRDKFSGYESEEFTHLSERLEVAYNIIYLYCYLLKEHTDLNRLLNFLKALMNFIVTVEQGSSDVYYEICDYINQDWVKMLQKDLGVEEFVIKKSEVKSHNDKVSQEGLKVEKAIDRVISKNEEEDFEDLNF